MPERAPQPTTDLAALLAFAEELLHESGRLALVNFRRLDHAVERKDDASPVSRVDREVEALLRARIERRYPEHGIQGEESGASGPASRFLWLLDPIDGTRSFLAGNPLFGTLIALLEDGLPLLGAIDHPALGERWLGARGLPTRLHGQVVATRPCASLSDALLATTSPYLLDAARRPAFERLRGACADLVLGGDCFLYASLASGHLDLVCEAGLAPHDFCALVPVVEGAGGVISDWRGEPLTLQSPGDVLAAGDRRVHAQAVALLAGALR